METMYNRIKRMSMEEMRHFVYWVYQCGNKDGKLNCCDSEAGYFGGYVLTKLVSEVMPNDNVNDLWNKFDEVYNGV